nr:hypothetical protein [Tanacetum cinerariifolium]
MTITRSGMTLDAIEELISWRVEEVLVAQEANQANRNAGLIDENQSHNRDDNDNGSRGNGNNGNNNGDGNQNGGNKDIKRNAPVARVCTYKDFLNCQPRNFSGTKGVVGLDRMANGLMVQKVHMYVEMNAEQKRKFHNNP